MQKLLFVGLGRMGANMAGHLAKSNDYQVSVWNRSPEKTAAWLASNQGEVYVQDQNYHIIILCVGNDHDVRALLNTELALFKQLNAGGCVIDHTTTSAELAKEMYASAAELGVQYLDAPVSGGEAGAVDGTLSCMVGGDSIALNACKNLLKIYCANVVHIGDAGAGQIAKMANQFCIAGLLAGLSEAITLVKHEGLEADNVFKAIKGGAAQSWQMDNRFSTMVKGDFDFGFAVDHMIKDLKYAIDQSTQQGWDPIVSKMVCEWYQALSLAGGSTQDTSSLIKHYQ